MPPTFSDQGSIQEITLASRHLGRSERLFIYTPPRYSLLYSYPVLYVQDGDDYLALGRLAAQLDQLAAQKDAIAPIAVFLPVEKAERTGRYHPEGEAHHAYVRFLAEEVVSYVDAHYSTEPLGYGRTLLGESLGGVVSLFTSFAYPHTFSQVACQSGAFCERLLKRIEEIPAAGPLSVYLEAGLDERQVETSKGVFDLYAANQQLREVMQKKGATVRFETFDGDHTWGYWQANLSRILSHFYETGK